MALKTSCCNFVCFVSSVKDSRLMLLWCQISIYVGHTMLVPCGMGKLVAFFLLALFMWAVLPSITERYSVSVWCTTTAWQKIVFLNSLQTCFPEPLMSLVCFQVSFGFEMAPDLPHLQKRAYYITVSRVLSLALSPLCLSVSFSPTESYYCQCAVLNPAFRTWQTFLGYLVSSLWGWNVIITVSRAGSRYFLSGSLLQLSPASVTELCFLLLLKLLTISQARGVLYFFVPQ